MIIMLYQLDLGTSNSSKHVESKNKDTAIPQTISMPGDQSKGWHTFRSTRRLFGGSNDHIDRSLRTAFSDGRTGSQSQSMGRDADGPGSLFFLGNVDSDGIAVTLFWLPKHSGEVLGESPCFVGIRN